MLSATIMFIVGSYGLLGTQKEKLEPLREKTQHNQRPQAGDVADAMGQMALDDDEIAKQTPDLGKKRFWGSSSAPPPTTPRSFPISPSFPSKAYDCFREWCQPGGEELDPLPEGVHGG
eukprot:RCo027265